MKKYQEIFQDLTKQISNGEYPPLSKLPDQQELASEYGTSRVTIQKVINMLKHEGLVTTKRGKGTFVNSNGQNGFKQNAGNYVGLTKWLGSHHELSSEIISFQVRLPDETEIEKLSITENDPVYDIIRLRRVDKKPFSLEYTVMPWTMIPGITQDTLKTSIYAHITEKLSLPIGQAFRRIRADKADSYDIMYLKVDKYDPILELDQVVCFENGRPFEYSQTRYSYKNGEIHYTSIDQGKW